MCVTVVNKWCRTNYWNQASRYVYYCTLYQSFEHGMEERPSNQVINSKWDYDMTKSVPIYQWANKPID